MNKDLLKQIQMRIKQTEKDLQKQEEILKLIIALRNIVLQREFYRERRGIRGNY
jgi:hypothetical protein